MADPNVRPRRVSMAYILGFSNKPYKDPPTPRPPPPPSGFAQVMATPGAILEWTASDGRKGKISGAGKQRLTAASLALLPSERRSVNDALNQSAGGKKDEVNKRGAGAKNDGDNPHGWTSEDDEKLMDWKNEFGTGPWQDCAAAIGKPEHECKERFKKIKPADWRPPGVKDKGKGGGNQKSGKKDKKQTQNEGAAEGNDNNGTADADGENAPDNPWGAAWDNNGWNNNEWNTFPANAGGTGDAGDLWNTANVQKNYGGNSVKVNSQQAPNHDESKSRSHRHSQHKSHSHGGRGAVASRNIQVTPDSTFSADDLRIIARILQQDCSMVWNRVSWRFRDKTGRNLHPDVFEKKLTGTTEGKGGERGARKAR